MNVLFVFFTDPPSPFSSSVAALAAVVRRDGHTPSARMVTRAESIAEVAEEILARQADVIGVSCMTRDWPGARALLEQLAPHTNAYRVVGGYHASLGAHDVARSEAVDAIAIGEGERPLSRLLTELATGRRPDASFPGMWVRGPEGFTDSIPGASSEPDIAALPLWDYEVFGDMRAHIVRGVNTFGPHADHFLPVRASRGCPFTCAYCSAPRWGELGGFAEKERRNRRPVAHLCAELAGLRDRYAPDGFEFWDEHFPLDLDWLRELARTYPATVGLPFKVEMHPRAATRERLALLVAAGCTLFHCGVEAGDPTLRRDVLHRRTTDAQLQRVFDDCRELGLPTSASLMTSLPSETRAMARSTVDLLRKLRPGSFMWSNYQPLPGTPLGDAAVAEWPGPAGRTFSDYAPPTLDPPLAVTEAERKATFAELRRLQLELVEAASAGRSDARPRTVDVPPDAEPVPVQAVAAVLGLACAPMEEGVHVRHASLREDALHVEVAGPGLEGHTIVLEARGEARYFKTTPHLGLSYRGKHAPPALLQALERMTAAVRGLAFQDLEAAARGRDGSG